MRRVGSGGMAEVWKARASGPAGFEKTFALKLVLPELSMSGQHLDMFVDEAKLVAQLNHPNIVQVTDFGRADKTRWFLAMEYVEGQNLQALCTRSRATGMKIPLEVALLVTLECCKALGFAHSKRVVHRDVSPHNVLLGYSGEIKLSDFGIAKVASAVQRTAVGAIRGKAAYMSPEQVRGETLDGRSDLFSLGIVLFEMVTGERMFEGNALDIMERIAAFTLEGAPLDALPRAVRDVVARTLEPDREKRFRNAEKLEEAVVSLLGTGALEARKALAAMLQRLFSEERRLESMEGNEQTHVQEHTEITVTSSLLHDAFSRSESLSPEHGVIPGGDAPSRPPSTFILPPPESSVHRPRPSGLGATLAIGAAALALIGALTIEWSPRKKSDLVLATPTILAGNAAPPETPEATPDETATPPETAHTATPRPTPTATPLQIARATPRPVATARPRQTPAATPRGTPVAAILVKSGLLRVNARPWVEVWVDGKKVAKETPYIGHFPAGEHRIRLVNAVESFQVERVISIADGQDITLYVDVPAGKVTAR